MIIMAAFTLAGCVNGRQGDKIPELDGQYTNAAIRTGAPAVIPVKVTPFIDVSKGMSGYYSQSGTQLQRDVWDVIWLMDGKWRVDSVVLLSEQAPKHIDINTFHDKLCAGKLLEDDNTSIPQMLERIVCQCDTTEDMVAVLISDMKYSPPKNKSPQVLLKQYSTEIEKIFSKKNIAASLICAVSEYNSKSQKCDTSPYYYLVIGNPERIAPVRNFIVRRLKNNDSFVDVSEKGVEYGQTLTARHEKAKGVMPLDKDNLIYGGYKVTDTDTIAVTLKVDMSPYPQSLRNDDTLNHYLLAGSSGFAKCDVSGIMESDSTALLTISVYNFKEKTQTITVSLVGFNPSSARGIDRFFDAVKEGDCDKTYSINHFFEGFSDGRQLQSTVEIQIKKGR